MQAPAFEISEVQRKRLCEWTQSGDARLVQRAQVVLLSHAGRTAEEVSAELGVARVTVYKWRKRFAADGLGGLRDLPRSGQPRKLAVSTRDALVERTVLSIPPRGVRWSVRGLARDAGITEHQVRRIWNEHGLQPHRRFDIPAPTHFARGWKDVQGHLCALFLTPPHGVVAWAVRQLPECPRDEQLVRAARSRRLRRSVRALREGGDSLFAVLRRLSPGQDPRRSSADVDALMLSLSRLCAQLEARDYRLHVVCSSEVTLAELRKRVEMRALAVSLTALPMTCVWAETLENWLSDGRRRGDDLVAQSELRAAIQTANHQLDLGQRLTGLAWSQPPKSCGPTLARSA